ncbi:hypothetical protein [Bradyrhizobium erythrophlei]|jgi:hypothetical protein|uniref:Uncharacterized protein n=1 Tax=Bradyrhizobium erythrophlei TaxID=1437360 RepID=A0A1M5MVX0_9BRAD|nr:hypothetical protein [Bradyrhizobium erythrophlei]SHG81476.1 hypothetical protein SAMN05444169_4276 [Bradyrhizobium erythrophlei]
MRVAVLVVFVSVLTTPSKASQSCMSKTEARHSFHSSHIYWHGVDHCWDATPIRRQGGQHRAHHHEPEAAPPAVMPMPSPDLRRSANAMAVDEPATDLITATPWVERWNDITQVVPPKPIVVIERKPGPMVTPRSVVMVIVTIMLTLVIVEILFGGMINERMRKRRHRGFVR